jgi:uncharacterized protein
MHWKRIQTADSASYVIVLDPDDEAISVLSAFAAQHDVTSAQVTGIGAFAQARVGWFDRHSRRYRPIAVDQQCEVLSLLGDVAVGANGKPQLHLHAVLGLADGSTRGGHLLDGRVWPTLEVIIRDTPAELRKTDRPELGLALIDLDR